MKAQEFIFNTPLYHRIKGEEEDTLLQELEGDLRVDGYNSQRGIDSTYTISSKLQCRNNYGSYSLRHIPFEYPEVWFMTLKCGRYGDTLDLILYFDEADHSIQKVGQYPSIADIHIAQIKQYNKVLPKEDLKEFTRAIGLAANGVGIGSFVYLRRIFENLIFEAYNTAKNNGAIDEEKFKRLRIDERIKELKHYLPNTLVEIAGVYGILSKGIHQLSEEECLAYFDAMRVGIEIILDDKLEQKKREEKRKSAIASISKISSKENAPNA